MKFDNNLNLRLNYLGGNQEERFIKDKERSLSKALLYSYQAATLERDDGAQFRCLINSNKLKLNYDIKVLSIKNNEIRLNPEVTEYQDFNQNKTSKSLEPTLVYPGMVFRWVEKDTYWLIVLEYLEEDAYFRGEIYKCNTEVEINGKKYRAYNRGPVETAEEWFQKAGIMWNNLNYSSIMYITKDENTLNFFHRFAQFKIDGQTWEVAATNPFYGDGIIQVMLVEAQNNNLKEQFEQTENIPTFSLIEGPQEVYPYDVKKFTINQVGGRWSVSNPKIKVVEENESSITLDIQTTKSGSFTLAYQKEDEVIELPIKIKLL